MANGVDRDSVAAICRQSGLSGGETAVIVRSAAGLSYPEIAAELHASVHAVECAGSRARRKMRQEILRQAHEQDLADAMEALIATIHAHRQAPAAANRNLAAPCLQNSQPST